MFLSGRKGGYVQVPAESEHIRKKKAIAGNRRSIQQIKAIQPPGVDLVMRGCAIPAIPV